jgi:chorismate mutase/prephenate dehydratase
MSAKAAYQGIRGSFGEQAALAFFGADADLLPCASFEEVFEAASTGEAERGILPVENTSTGSITDVLDLLIRHDCYICGETLVRVSHSLLGVRGAAIGDVREVYSHPQGFLQCAAFLKDHPDWIRIAYVNTAYSARFVAETGDRSKAAIAEGRNAAIWGLDTLAADIHDQRENVTRFVVIRRDPDFPAEADKTSLAFALKLL